MLEVKVDLDKAVRKADIKPMVSKSTGNMSLTVPVNIRENGFDAAAGIVQDESGSEIKSFVWYWDREQKVGLVMTVEEDARLRAAAQAAQDQATVGGGR